MAIEDSKNNKLDTKGYYTLIQELRKEVIDLKAAVALLQPSSISDSEVFENTTQRDSFFLGSISPLTPLAPNRAVITDIGTNVILEVWGGATITDPANYNASNWINSENITYTTAQIKSMYESNANTNAFTDILKSKLDGIEATAEVNETATEIKAKYEGNANTNAFTDSEKTKLSECLTETQINQKIINAFGLKFRVGSATSTTRNAQDFTFTTPFATGSDSDVFVFVQVKRANDTRQLSVVNSSKIGFTIDRYQAGASLSVDFDYIAFSLASPI